MRSGLKRSSGILHSVEGTAMDAAFNALTVERGLLHELAENWATAATEVPMLGTVAASHAGPRGRLQVIERDEGVIQVRIVDGFAHVLLACRERDDLAPLMAVVRHLIPPRTAEAGEDHVEATFWSMAFPNPSKAARRLEAPAWETIAANYSPATRRRLAALMTAQPPLAGGGLILWHGPPGTGKTNALRALAREWRDRAELHYVTDPEALLGRPAYLEAVLLGGDPGLRWRLVVLEDAGELLAPDAKERAGQGIARLLNATDGLIGQGLKVVVLITGNEPLERLHPAVGRPGRCAVRIQFEEFDDADATAWLAERAQRPVGRVGRSTLAQLYARLEGRSLNETRTQVGFTA